MMDQDSQFLKLQAYLDGELSAKEKAEVADWLAKDREAQLLLAELQNTNAALDGYETEIKLPESREFFWSKIEREIKRENAAPVARQSFSFVTWLQRHMVPVSGVAVACVALLLVLQLSPAGSQVAEIELSSNDMGVATYRNQQEKMTMVWLYDKSDSEFTDSDSTASFPTQ
jgi:anti-sigma factor RsiW